MTFFFFEYSLLFISLCFTLVLSIFIFVASYIFSFQKASFEKLSPYECGFDPFEDSRNQFDVKFYLVALLFLIFDLEAIFLFPWVLTIKTTGFFSFFAILDFFFELIIGFYYVWSVGALEW
jgi:NADH-quinone oxidoreductase subunit A